MPISRKVGRAAGHAVRKRRAATRPPTILGGRAPNPHFRRWMRRVGREIKLHKKLGWSPRKNYPGRHGRPTRWRRAAERGDRRDALERHLARHRARILEDRWDALDRAMPCTQRPPRASIVNQSEPPMKVRLASDPAPRACGGRNAGVSP